MAQLLNDSMTQWLNGLINAKMRNKIMAQLLNGSINVGM